MTEPEKQADPIHVETHASNPEKAAEHMCDSAPDKEKCQEFVERLGEASTNIDAKDE